MMILRELLKHIQVKKINGDSNKTITHLASNSSLVQKDSLFFAQKGTLNDGHHYIKSAIEKGANSIICEDLPSELKDNVCYIVVKNVNEIIGKVSSAFYNHPSYEMKVIGVTGTNGKTTISTLLFRLFTELGYKCGLISTVENVIVDKSIKSTHTTPDAISLQYLLRQMVDEHCSYIFMEVSSHAIHQGRINGIRFYGGIFTNITHDHLDYHKTFDEYIKVKKHFFDHLPKDAFALTNADEKRGMVMLQNTEARKQTYALRIPANYKGKIIENELDGLFMNIGGDDVHFRMSGIFNAYNLLAVYGTALLCGEHKLNVLQVLSSLEAPSGRFETIRSKIDNLLGIIDYAHTPDALLNVLTTIKQGAAQQEIITVIGCGGDRDRAKRPVMANVAATHSARVIMTSDNPRDEDPEKILDEMESGLNPSQRRKVLRITDRKEAIKTAVSLAQVRDVLLIAGKGHESYQEIKGEKRHFNDKEILLEMFEMLGR